MPTTAASVPSRSRGRTFLKVIAIGSLVWVIAIAMLALEVGTLSRNADVLRKEMLAALDTPARREIQITVGPGALAAARLVVRWLDAVPVEARDALNAVRTASVGVYRLAGEASPTAREKMFAAADRALGRRGFFRVIGVNDAHQTVVIYSPQTDDDSSTQHICLAVCEAHQLVIVEGAINGDRLAGFAAQLRPRLALK